MIDLNELASGARWETSQLINDHSGRDISTVPWNGSATDARGFVRLHDSVTCEDGTVRKALQMHPKWVSKGAIKGWLPWVEIPTNAVFRAAIGFLEGAGGSDGVRFQVWEHHNTATRHVWNRVLDFHKTPDGHLFSIEADLSHLSGHIGIELRVDAGNSSGRDWAVWIDPRIEAGEGTPSKVWTFSPTVLTVDDRNETRRVAGRGDEPYLGAVYFRSIFGRLGSTKVGILDELTTLGNNVGDDEAVLVPDTAGLNIGDVGSASDEFKLDVSVMGYQLVAMESDRTGKRNLRSRLSEIETKLFDALKDSVEGAPLGLLTPETTQERIEEAVFGPGSGSRPFRDFLSKALRWLVRADDLIGTNSITVIGLSRAGADPIISRFDPTSISSPVAILEEQDFRLEFAGSDAKYFVDVELRQTDPGVLVR